MKVICTTVIRHSEKGESHGYIYEIDWNNKKIVKKVEMPNPKADWLLLKLNPRGGSRGGRGVQITDEAIYVANDNMIIMYDHNWNEIRRISNQLFTGIHEIWVSSTGIDSAIKINFSGNVLKMWSPRTDPLVKKVLGIDDNYRTSWPPKWIGWGYLNPYKILDHMLRSFLSKVGLPERSKKFRLPYHYMNYDSNSKLEKWLWKFYRAFPKLRQDDFHLNCVSGYKNEIIITLLKLPWRNKACMVNIEPSVEIELGDMALGMPHNGIIIDDHHLIINDNGTQGIKLEFNY